MPTDAYELLGISRDADETQIKKAFRKLARELHPDVNNEPGSEERFKEVAEAYEILSDPERRATYDRYGYEGLRSGGYAPTDFGAFGGLSDILDAFFGGGGGGGFFGGGGRGGPQPGRDAAAEAVIELADVARQTSAEVRFEAIVVCERCHGNAAEPGTPIKTCERCGGAGRLQGVTRTPFGQVVRQVECDVCHGDGRIPEQPCTTCSGRGRTIEERTLKVDVPAGIEDGQRIRIGGNGHAGDAGAPAGDLYVTVRVRDDARFVRDGSDLVTVLDVPAPLAALGDTFTVETLDGEEEVEIEAGTQPGEILVLRGRGLPSLRGRRPGDLRIVVNVVIPKRLNREQKDMLRRFADTLDGGHSDTDGESVMGKLRRVLGSRA
ncbi:MAG: Chaperone protein DnaJ [uncultured Solirubrobacteraceae bacterium]|uniref:Chaperone protein DnaJ n=1 Tax=uncultured Solirubrobacteraceae bacterium TaxID=1162706 RepID=A0A6J4TAY5_9ACTN|nr:MAG: Chaperone protein DnaJ [uncultured Solirubrobacteraceae bacterium]